MAITFLKYAKFDPKDVVDKSFDIDENWKAIGLTFAGTRTDGQTEIIEYDLALLHKKTLKESAKMRITLNIYGQPTYGGDYIEVHIRSIEDRYGYAYSRHRLKQKNIYLLLKGFVKSVEFIKGIFSMRRATKRETVKMFGKVFNNETR